MVHGVIKQMPAAGKKEGAGGRIKRAGGEIRNYWEKCIVKELELRQSPSSLARQTVCRQLAEVLSGFYRPA